MSTRQAGFFLLCALILLLFSIMVLAQMQQTPFLYSYDPWSHVFFTRHGESASLYSNQVEVYNGLRELAYRSFLRTDMFLLATITSIDTYVFYQYGSLVLRVLYLLMVINLVLVLTRNNKTTALLMLVFAGSSSYFVWRSYITFPENMALLFHLMMLWAIERFLIGRRRKFLFMIALSLVGVLYIHPKSLFFSGMIYAAFGARLLADLDWRHLLQLGLITLASLIMTVPVLWDTIQILIKTIEVNIGSDDPFTAYASTLPTYLPPTFATYESYVGGLLLLLTLLGCMVIVRQQPRGRLHLLVLLSLSLMLSLGTRLAIYVPTDRMQAYLFLPVLAISAVGLNWCLQQMQQRRQYWLLASGGVLLMMLMIMQTRPWFGYGRGEIEMADFVNMAFLSSEDDQLLIAIGNEAERVSNLLADPLRVCHDRDTDFFVELSDLTVAADCANAAYRIELGSNKPAANYLALNKFGDYTLYVHESLP